MASTITCFQFHIVFSTKHREDMIEPATEEELYKFVGGICRERKSKLMEMGGTANHVHLLASTHKLESIPDLLRDIKGSSSSWYNERFSPRKQFRWQEGYFAFTVAPSMHPALRAYFARQKQHHARRDFKDEMRELFRKYEVEWDEAHVWT